MAMNPKYQRPDRAKYVRVNVMFDPDTLAAVDDLAGALQISRSQLIRDLLAESSDHLAQLTEHLRKVSTMTPAQAAIHFARMHQVQAQRPDKKIIDFVTGDQNE